jgi:hypothetical protein
MRVEVTDQCWEDAHSLNCTELLERFVARKDDGDFLKRFDHTPPPLLKKRFERGLRLIAYNAGDEVILARIVQRGSRAYQAILESPLSLPLTPDKKTSDTVCNPLPQGGRSAYMIESRVSSIEKRMDQIEADLKGVSDRLSVLCQRAKFYHQTDPESALNQARKAAELICRELYDSSGLGESAKPSTKCGLDELIQQLQRNEIVSRTIYLHLCTVRDYGNFGSHDQGDESMLVTPDLASPCLEALACLAKWYVTQRASHPKD